MSGKQKLSADGDFWSMGDRQLFHYHTGRSNLNERQLSGKGNPPSNGDNWRVPVGRLFQISAPLDGAPRP